MNIVYDQLLDKVEKFTLDGDMVNNFDFFGNVSLLEYKESSTELNSFYISFPINEFRYDQSKIELIYNPAFTEFSISHNS